MAMVTERKTKRRPIYSQCPEFDSLALIDTSLWLLPEPVVNKLPDNADGLRITHSMSFQGNCKASLTAALGIVHFGYLPLVLLVCIPFIGVPSFCINPSISAQ